MGAPLARASVARRSLCQASLNSSLGALNLLARAEGCASLGRRSEIEGIRSEEREVEEQLLHQKCMTIPRRTIMTTLTMRTTTTITRMRSLFQQAQPRSLLFPLAPHDAQANLHPLHPGNQLLLLCTLHSISSLPFPC